MGLRIAAKVETRKKKKVNQETMTKTLDKHVYEKITTSATNVQEAKVIVLFSHHRVCMCAIRTDECWEAK